MSVNVEKFGRQFHFPTEAILSLSAAAEALTAHNAASVFASCKDQLFSQSGDPWEVLTCLAKQAGLHPFAVHQLFLIYCTEETKARYRAAGYPDALYYDSLKDLKYKMEETYQVYGVWGVYCAAWLSSFILLKCFCLGRLQFEILHSEFHYETAGHILQQHAPIINVHIPSFGRLYYDEVLDAYARAAAFFAPHFPDGAIWFHCETWILYPPVNALLPDGNMRRFSKDFDVVHACIDPSQDDRYRVFMLPPEVPVTEYPENNALQRDLKAWLLQGNTMGVGFGLFLYQKGQIIPHS